MNKLIIKTKDKIISEELINKFDISLLDFLKKNHKITLQYDYYILGIDDIIQTTASEPENAFYHTACNCNEFWTIWVNNKLVTNNLGKKLPYNTCVKKEDKKLPCYPAMGASEIILEKGMDIRLEFMNISKLSARQLQEELEVSPPFKVLTENQLNENMIQFKRCKRYDKVKELEIEAIKRGYKLGKPIIRKSKPIPMSIRSEVLKKEKIYKPKWYLEV